MKYLEKNKMSLSAPKSPKKNTIFQKVVRSGKKGTFSKKPVFFEIFIFFKKFFRRGNREVIEQKRLKEKVNIFKKIIFTSNINVDLQNKKMKNKIFSYFYMGYHIAITTHDHNIYFFSKNK